MKYIYFFIFFIGFSIIGIGQSCLPNGITFTTQGQIDSFSINYPGCRVIDGDVSFNYKNDISNLLGLSQIYKINGNFTLKSTNCINLEGLNNLTEVGGDFSIGEYYYYTYTGGYAPSVTSFKGLDALNVIGGRLSIIGTSIQDFKELKSIEQIGSLWVVANLNLLNFVGLEKIKKLDEFIVGLSGYVNDNSTFSVIGNESLQNFEGLSGLRSIHGKFNVIGNIDFYDFTGLSALKSIGSFKLSANNKMVNFSGLNNLDIINHDFVIGEVINTDYYHYHSDIPVGNELLVNFDGLNNLGEIGGIFKVVGENKLTNFAELLTLSNIGSLEIKSPSLLSLNGLQQITSIENVDIQQFNLESLSGLDNLDTVIGTLNLSNLGRLKSFDGLGRLKYIGEDFILKNVDSVTNFEGLNNLEYIDGDFLVGDVFIVPEIGPHTGPWENKREYQGNNSLINFQGLDKLKTINGVFQIAFNQNLTNLFGLEYLENINSLNIGYLRIHNYGWGLQFFGNDNLISVQALDNAIIKNDLFVFGNAKLENLNGIHLENCIEGSVEISGNSSLTDISSLLGVRNISGGLVLGGAIDNYTKAPGKKWNDDVYLGNMFTEITGLDSLESVGFMHIQGNENLKNINAFSKLKNIETVSHILMNPKLSECNIGACESLNNVSIDFSENAEGCNSMDDILCNPIIKGYAYYDVNKNGEHDSWESRAPNVKIFVSDSIQKLTDLDGRFFISGQPGDDLLISVDLDNKWELTSETDVFDVSLDNNNRIQTIKFGLFPIDSMIDPVLSLTSYTTTCDDEVEFFIRYRNGLEQPFSDCVLRYDSTLEYIGQNSNQNIIFLQNSKLPFGTRDYSIKFKLPNVDSKINLDLLCGSDTFNYSPVVSCNLEVNNVIVMPPGIGDRHFTPIGEPLVYTINFENSGESILEDATIEIDVDENLDVSTLQVLEANDNVETIIKGQHISFIFKNRFLNCNSEFIKGLISYSIEPFSNILDSTVVYCTAKIIIGEDEMIETNTTENTLLKNGAKRIKLHIPIAGTYKEDFIIVNYVDWKDQGIQDANCGTKTYDGHQGTDFSLPSFKEMDEGVDVMAADSGTVIAIHDGEFDRNTAWNVPLGLGNYVAIEHNGKINTYYGHLKKNSLQVVVGDKVVVGQKLGEVGSSGNSTGPHLHFEMWYDSTQVIDPFSGPCGNTDTYWENELPYDDSFRIWETGFLDFNPTFEALFERPESPIDGNRFFRDLAVEDAKITHWELIHGLLKGDIVKYVWLTPDGTEWFNFNYEIDQDYWHYHGWAYIDLNNTLPLGEWSCNYFVNDSLVGQYPFVVDVWAASEDIAQNEISWYASPNGWTFNATQEGIDNIAIWTVDGKKIYNQKGIHSEKVNIPVSIAKGLYIAQIQLDNGKMVSLKIVK